MANFVAYYRVSTRSQADSGLGLIAQRLAVERYVSSVGGLLLTEFEEVDSGGKLSRPQFESALDYCRAKRAVLVIAKLDRLARNVYLISTLMESGIEFVAADMPLASRLTLHIVAAIAEHEKTMIAARTREALRAAKLRGVRLGNPNWVGAQRKATATAAAKADDFAQNMRPVLDRYDPFDQMPPSTLAKLLNGGGYKPARALKWTAPSIKNLRRRLSARKTQITP